MKGDKGMATGRGEVSALWEVALPISEFIDLAFSEASGSVEFGWAHTANSKKVDDLASWTRFHDYIMEGSVAYELRALGVAGTTRLEIRLLGTNRDEYVHRSVQHHLDQLPIELELVQRDK